MTSSLTFRLQLRDLELSRQWKAYLAETLLMMCWIAGSYLFTAITLSSISVYEGGLSPSVAFTALAVFHRLEATLSLVPGLVTDFFDAWISFDRVERFLSSPERIDRTIDDDSIVFEGASIDWPSDEESLREAKLRGLNLTFPNNSISIIAGPTGAGKSLLLSAIVGEADVLCGTVRRPKPNSAFGGGSNGSCINDWIIPKTMALVAQTPWIENATIRDNILFSLPLVESRYTRVLQACALLQDLGTMEDGDMTEVGAHGISLSGGQRSRLSLARALYSRAEILVMDDIFSAVDIHVGRHILDHALTGDVAGGRTCILATHHLQLCLPKASFLVMLKEGAVEYAGSPKDMPQSSTWIPIKEKKTDESGQYLTATSTGSPPVEEGARRKTNSSSTSDGSQMESTASGNINSRSSSFAPLKEMDIDKPNKTPRKLVLEEGRETGRVKLSVYKEYFGAASAWPWVFWLVVIGLLIGCGSQNISSRNSLADISISDSKLHSSAATCGSSLGLTNPLILGGR